MVGRCCGEVSVRDREELRARGAAGHLFARDGAVTRVGLSEHDEACASEDSTKELAHAIDGLEVCSTKEGQPMTNAET
jgi:hypothetical protein